jgi:glycine/D-amino acid oxidase-like deaminating enzyme
MVAKSAFLSGAQFVVIGAGAVGSVVAYRLAQAGAHVTIVEKHYPGGGTSGNSFAWLNSFSKTPREYHRLNARSIREHRDLQDELDGDWAKFNGGISWEDDGDTTRVRQLRDKVRQLHQWGYRIESLTPQQVMNEIEPDLFIDSERVEEVFYAPSEGWLDGVALSHSATRAAIRRYGATLRNDRVVGLKLNQDAIDSVELASGESIPADAVINAAGPFADDIAAFAGVELPMTRQPGLLVTTKPAPVDITSVVHAPDVYLHADGGSRYLLQREGFDGLAERDEPVDLENDLIQKANESAGRVVPNMKGIELESIRIGVRPMPKDGHPIIGFDPTVGGLYHTVMHSGITLSAIVGTLVTEDLLGLEPPELSLFRPQRFENQDTLTV